MSIVDAWEINKRFGFIGQIRIPAEVIDYDEDFSILLRFSRKLNSGNFKLLNMKFYNFYNGGYEILIHKKWWNTDKLDPYTVGFVAENLNVEEAPELLFWRNRQTVS